MVKDLSYREGHFYIKAVCPKMPETLAGRIELISRLINYNIDEDGVVTEPIIKLSKSEIMELLSGKHN